MFIYLFRKSMIEISPQRLEPSPVMSRISRKFFPLRCLMKGSRDFVLEIKKLEDVDCNVRLLECTGIEISQSILLQGSIQLKLTLSFLH